MEIVEGEADGCFSKDHYMGENYFPRKPGKLLSIAVGHCSQLHFSTYILKMKSNIYFMPFSSVKM